jgi:hypothetical protein
MSKQKESKQQSAEMKTDLRGGAAEARVRVGGVLLVVDVGRPIAAQPV